MTHAQRKPLVYAGSITKVVLLFASLPSLYLIYWRRYLEIIALFLLGLPRQARICSLQASLNCCELSQQFKGCFTAQQSSANTSLCCFILSKGPSWPQPHYLDPLSLSLCCPLQHWKCVWGHISSLPSRLFLAAKPQTGLNKPESILWNIIVLFPPALSFVITLHCMRHQCKDKDAPR